MQPGRIMLQKNSIDTIANRTRYLPACSPVPQPTAPPRTPKIYIINLKIRYDFCVLTLHYEDLHYS